MIPDSHPYWHVRDVVGRHEDVAGLTVSYYAYQPQTLSDRRVVKGVPREQFLDASLVEGFMNDAPPDHELAIHSSVDLRNGETRHLVMVDMSTKARAHVSKLRTFLGDNFFQRLTWFDSGRSFHGYGEDLLFDRDWVSFMGLLLLANQPAMEPTVDPRWIGHRLVAGYAALRWTKNSSYYLGWPAKVDLAGRVPAAVSQVGPLGRSLNKP